MITILTSFTGYPEGKKRAFRAGETVDDLPGDYAELIVSKGLAVRTVKEKAK